MQLPSQFQPFGQPTLIVVTDSQHAKLFLAFEQNVNVAGIVDVAADDVAPGREVMKSGKDHHVTGDHLYPALNKELMQRLHKQEFEKLAFTVPEDLENELKESLHIDLLKRADVFVPKNLMHHDLIDIVAEVQENM
ncbi:host attachment protein [Candidatus Uhrbacteria bacterium]|nr:host attachment protein [Candidatus Uhrbacteria bacterium]